MENRGGSAYHAGVLVRVLVRVILVALLCCAGAVSMSSVARAEGGKLALLPLDTPDKLAIYGQPVAAEVARALQADGLDVVVVGAQMAVPRDTTLMVEGSLLVHRKKVVVELRLRPMDSRKPIVTVTSSEATLATLEGAAGEVSRMLLPRLREELAKRTAGLPAGPTVTVAPPPKEGGPIDLSTGHVAETALPTAMIAVTTAGVPPAARSYFGERLMAAASALTAARWKPRPTEISQINGPMLLAMAATEPGSLGVAFDVRELGAVEERGVHFGAVRARVLIALGGKIVFDREITTDTVVGARKGDLGALLDLLARELTAILRPKYRRVTGEAPRLEPAPSAARERDVRSAAR